MRYFARASVYVLILVLGTVVSCSCDHQPENGQPSPLQQWMTPNGKIKVLSTIAMIDDLVRQIGGSYVDTAVLITGELDPHSYQIVKGDDEKLAFADLIFFSGLGLEHGPTLQAFLTHQPKSIGLGNHIEAADPSAILQYQGQIDPHIWMDISLWARTIPYIVDALSQKDPVHAESFRTNGDIVKQTMLAAHDDVRKELQAIPSKKRYLVTSHDAFNYFTRAYLADPGEAEASWSMRFIAPEGLAPESQISATDIKEVIDHLKKYDIHVLFPESNVNRDSIRKIVHAANKQGLSVIIAEVTLYADAMGGPGSEGETYLKMIQHDANAMADYMKYNGE